MIIESTFISDLYLIKLNQISDLRGSFTKTIHKETFDTYSIDSNFTESFYSKSHKNVIRGMHFQIPPDDHSKLVYLISGSILDVILDIRKESPTYGKFFSIVITADNPQAIYIGKGLAHGFKSLEDNSVVEYHTTTSHSKQNETGIKYSSFGFDWGSENDILSERDLNFKNFIDFNSPF
ncbi:dTDP-4-dehydrorhamnose 3,5-epimerase family protein [Pedobacter alpinus]|uniref:dTDP-4-dehydrorhamnose 3,5-epimerase n=1 Tax=Pedobacter alpinus TaxID=1590643 RepID=A0ABW5TSP3_9SPHI